MSMTVLVTGAAGNLGGLTVPRLVQLGHRVKALSRRPHSGPDAEWIVGDLVTGEGVDQAVAGVDTIVHCATDGRSKTADPIAAANLIDAARKAGVRHLVYVSIIGVDRHPLPYYRVKRRVENMIEASGIPYTIVRAAQFHDLAHLAMHYAAKVPVLMPVLAGTSFQSIDTAEVADRLAELATGSPAGWAPDLAGPQTLTMADMARGYLRATGRRRMITPLWLPGRVWSAYRKGLHLAPQPSGKGLTWEEFLTTGPKLKVPGTSRAQG